MNQTQQPADGQQYGQSENARAGAATGEAPPARGPIGRRYRTRNYLAEDVRTESIAALNQCLADAVVVQSQCKAAHWNVKGPNFYALHELFEDVAETLEGFIDDVAERVTALGGEALGTVRIAAENASVPTLPSGISDDRAMLEAIATSLAAFDATLYQQIQRASEAGDLDTADLLNEVSREVSKALWFVEAHLQREAPPRQATGAVQQLQGQGVQQQQSIQQ